MQLYNELILWLTSVWFIINLIYIHIFFHFKCYPEHIYIRTRNMFMYLLMMFLKKTISAFSFSLIHLFYMSELVWFYLFISSFKYYSKLSVLCYVSNLNCMVFLQIYSIIHIHVYWHIYTYLVSIMYFWNSAIYMICENIFALKN